MSRLLEVLGVTAGYGKITVLEDVSLTVDDGEAVALLGPNGAGKSTLLAVISGLVPLRQGAIRLDGDAIGDRAAHKRVRRGIVQVPEARRIFPALSVEDNLLLGAYPHERRASRLTAEFQRMYQLFPILGDRRRLAAATLSGGEAQMLALAMAIMARPRILMLDEPSLGLAPLVVEKIFAAIEDLRDAGTTILLVEQLTEQALDLASRAYVLSTGKITAHGTADEVRHSAELRAAYLG